MAEDVEARDERAPGPSSRPNRKRVAALVCLALLGVTVVVFAFQAARTTLALREAKAQATRAQTELTAGDLDSARRSLRGLRESAETAHRSSANPLWDLASALPLVGGNVEAVQLIASALDGIAGDSLPAALEVVADAQKGTFQQRDGRVDLAEVRRVTPALTGAADRIATENRRLASLEPRRLVSPLRGPATELRLRMADLDRAMGSAASVAGVLPAMLGGDGARNYVLVAQNTAELRATGGLPGALSIISARDGKLHQGFRGSAADFPILTKPVLPVVGDERDLYGPDLGLDIRQTNQTPDFPRAAELISAMVSRERGIKVDGVISVDPIALSQILEVTGPIEVGGEKFTAGNVVAKVLHEAYKRLPDPETQNAYFAAASGSIFDALINGRGDVPSLVRGVSAAAQDRRFLVWSRHQAEQRVLERGNVSGRLPIDTGPDPQVGMYLNDYSVAKINYFLDYGGQLEAVSCAPDRSQRLVARMQLTSSVPQPVSQLSDYIAGTGTVAPKGTNSLFLRIYAPLGGKLTAISVNGRAAEVDPGKHHGREVWTVRLQIPPGKKSEVLVELQTRPGQAGNPVLEWTPGMRRTINAFGAKSACI